MAKTCTPTQKPLLQARRLSRGFQGTAVIKDLSFELKAGDVMGLVGLNGAGKTTTLHLLSGLLAPSHGEVFIAGHSLSDQPKHARQALGFLPDPPALHDCLSVSEAIDLNARLHGMEKAARSTAREKVLAMCHLESVERKRITTLSKGFRQRTALALSLVHDPSVLILDEPASGLDPAQVQHLNELIKTLSTERAIVFSSHSLSDVQHCCTQIALLKNGELTQSQPPSATLQQRCYKLELRSAVARQALALLVRDEHIMAVDAHTWLLDLGDDTVDAVLGAIMQNNWGLRSFTPQNTRFESVLKQLQASTTQNEAA